MARSTSGRTGVSQVRAPRENGWTKSKRAMFLGALAETGNVTMAAKAVGLTARSVHALRIRDGAFAVLWEQALEASYERLENELLFCALGKPVVDANPAEADIAAAQAPVVPFDPALAIKVLQLRRGQRPGKTRGVMPAMKSQSEVDAALLKRLDALAAKRS